jgi:hypothetical protein
MFDQQQEASLFDDAFVEPELTVELKKLSVWANTLIITYRICFSIGCIFSLAVLFTAYKLGGAYGFFLTIGVFVFIGVSIWIINVFKQFNSSLQYGIENNSVSDINYGLVKLKTYYIILLVFKCVMLVLAIITTINKL